MWVHLPAAVTQSPRRQLKPQTLTVPILEAGVRYLMSQGWSP